MNELFRSHVWGEILSSSGRELRKSAAALPWDDSFTRFSRANQSPSESQTGDNSLPGYIITCFAGYIAPLTSLREGAGVFGVRFANSISLENSIYGAVAEILETPGQRRPSR